MNETNLIITRSLLKKRFEKKQRRNGYTFEFQMYLDDTWSRNFIVVVIINRGERGINENTVLLCEELLEKKEEEERKKERKKRIYVSFLL